MNLCKKCENKWICLEELGIKRRTKCSDFIEIVKEEDLPFSNKDENTFNAEACAMYEPDNLVTVDLKEVRKVASPFTDTVEGMLSNDYKERFKAEYQQTKIRYDELHAMLVKADSGKLRFNPAIELDLIRRQAQAMGQYLYYLEVRAQIEDINIID